MQFELIRSHSFPDFSSASSILFDNNKLYLVGDDASDILVLDKEYREIDRIKMFDYPGDRIPKSEKTDLEASVMMNINNETHLMAFGSASDVKRKVIITLPADGSKRPTIIDYSVFVRRLRERGIEQVNIEGATLIGDRLSLINRGNNSYRKNHLITTTKDFWKNQEECSIVVAEIVLPNNEELFKGASEIHFVPSEDLLLFTFTTEATSNPIDDGTIGDSYIGWIISPSNNPMNKLTTMVNLSDVHPDFKGQKIEGVCAEASEDDKLLLHLVADNDSGGTKIFKVVVKSK
ncbi:hypothetical protein WBG78_07875 [Chryseolinea sp. T2]|uniref:DUF6929 family protein n=1 Tax=Chryseolinea sp. T2 TaxID=3129255 RepID=UPI00307847A5